MNSSGITPMWDNVLVSPKVVEEKTKGGLYLPDDTKEREQFGQMEGKIVAISAGAFRYNYPEWPEDAPKPSEGDSAVFSRYQATEIKGKDDQTYWLMKDTSIAGILA